MSTNAEARSRRWNVFPWLGFRSRSPDRDNQTDARRRTAIREVIERQRSEAQAEMAGLTRRMNEALAGAATMLDFTAEYGQRHPDEEDAISAFERSAAAARLRIDGLQSEIAFFDELLSLQASRQ